MAFTDQSLHGRELALQFDVALTELFFFGFQTSELVTNGIGFTAQGCHRNGSGYNQSEAKKTRVDSLDE